MQFDAAFTAQLAAYLAANNLAIMDKRDAERLELIRNLFNQGTKRDAA